MKKIFIISSLLIFPITATSLYEQAQEYQKNEQFDEAIHTYKSLLLNAPYNINLLFNLGHCCLALGRGDEAIDAYQKITTVAPSALPAWYNNAYTKKTIGRLDEAIDLYKQIIEVDNNYEPAQLALGFAYLTKGDFDNGWKQHERYLKKSGKNGDKLRLLLEHNALSGKKILLRPEGGLGDTLQFIRYAEKLHDMGAYIIACVQKPLVPLFSSCTFIDELISHEDKIPPCHADATYMSLPAIFNDSEQTFPNKIPYIFADPQLVEKWKNELSNDHNFKIGICWQASVKNDESRLPIARRGCPLKHFLPLANIPNVSFYSLQKYDGVEELATIPDSFIIHHYDDLDVKEGAFMSTAALMKNLDLIITVDTAIEHLAGGLGCPVWLLLPYSTDWRWIHNKNYSPWYPTMKIFKQQKPFDWESVIKEVKQELAKMM